MTTYRSEIDQWLLVLFGVTGVGALVALAGMLYSGLRMELLLAAPILLVVAALPWWLVAATHYTVSTHMLDIRSGPFHWSVPLRQITAVTPTRSALSGPALSLDRLRIDYGANSSIMISPEHRSRFLQELRTRGVNVAVSR